MKESVSETDAVDLESSCYGRSPANCRIVAHISDDSCNIIFLEASTLMASSGDLAI